MPRTNLAAPGTQQWRGHALQLHDGAHLLGVGQARKAMAPLFLGV